MSDIFSLLFAFSDRFWYKSYLLYKLRWIIVSLKGEISLLMLKCASIRGALEHLAGRARLHVPFIPSYYCRFLTVQEEKPRSFMENCSRAKTWLRFPGSQSLHRLSAQHQLSQFLIKDVNQVEPQNKSISYLARIATVNVLGRNSSRTDKGVWFHPLAVPASQD